MDEESILVISFQGNPEVYFRSEEEVEKYFQQHDTTIEKVREDQECNSTPDWEIHLIGMR